ncbi:protein of unknown function [Cupriavidus neocaledonicus]|uniref:Uncharacterized protein n=1 Tax=Cupriavidus neocaledonicus TaxID=1040979 RepID=A0A375H7F0_9BURK|nr:hypothetical protein CBM2605_A100056 [Cupriavidus neocaledonicus]SPD46413.1 protein of unknown function [Cupriavidus neocaledonicus]
MEAPRTPARHVGRRWLRAIPSAGPTPVMETETHSTVSGRLPGGRPAHQVTEAPCLFGRHRRARENSFADTMRIRFTQFTVFDVIAFP